MRDSASISAAKSLQCLMDGTGAKFDCLDGDAFVSGMDGLREVENFRQGHRQEAIGLDSEPGEKAPVGDAAQQQRTGHTFGVGFLEDACQRWFSVGTTSTCP